MQSSRMPVDLSLLLVFSVVAETRSTTKAAERLCLTQPGVSHALGRLRRSMNDPLFIRNGRGLVPTARAVALVDPVNRLLNDAGRLLRPAAFNPATSTRTFRVALSDYVNLVLTRHLVRALTRHAPSVRLVIEAVSDRTVEVLRGGHLDAIVWRNTALPPSLRSRTIVEDPLIVAMDRAHPLMATGAGRDGISVADYVRFKHVQTVFMSPRDPIIDGALDKLGARRDVALSTKDFRSAIDALDGTQMLLTLPGRAFERLRTESIARVALPFVAPPVGYDLVWDGRNEPDAGFAWLADLIAGLGRQQQGLCSTSMSSAG